MDKYTSNKFSFFSFWLMITVVLLHSLNVSAVNCNDYICYLQLLISENLVEVAVPLFFMISGYFCFIKTSLKKSFDINFFINNNIKKIRTLLIPYLFWCSFWFFAIYLVQQIPLIKSYFSIVLAQMSLKDQLLNLFFYPFNFPFWFLRELMLLFIISPLIFILIQNLRHFFTGFIIIIFISTYNLFVINNLIFLKSSSLLYFSAGGILSLYGVKMQYFSTKMQLLFLALFWIGLNIGSVYFKKDVNTALTFLRLFGFFKNSIGIVFLWFAYDFFNKNKVTDNSDYYQYSFFIFAFHGIPIQLLVKVSKVMFVDKYLLFLSYIFIFILSAISSLALGVLTKKLLPKFYKFITGNR